jgi:hypothetical protein
MKATSTLNSSIIESEIKRLQALSNFFEYKLNNQINYSQIHQLIYDQDQINQQLKAQICHLLKNPKSSFRQTTSDLFNKYFLI